MSTQKIKTGVVAGVDLESFDREKFETDLQAFVNKLIDHPELSFYITSNPEELSRAIQKVSYIRIKDAAFRSLAHQLGCEIAEIPRVCNYHFGDYFHQLDIVAPVYAGLMRDEVVRKHLAYECREDALRVNCSDISQVVDGAYRLFLNEPRLPESFQ